MIAMRSAPFAGGGGTGGPTGFGLRKRVVTTSAQRLRRKDNLGTDPLDASAAPRPDKDGLVMK